MTRLERAKRFLSQTARPGLRVLSLAVLAVSAYGGTMFSVGGVFDDGGDYLSGTIDLDTVGSGGVLSAGLTLSPPVQDCGNDGGVGQNNQICLVSSPSVSYSLGSGGGLMSVDSGPYFYEVNFNGSDGSTLNLDIATNSLDGYTGGALCSDLQSCGGAETDYSDPIDLSYGELTEQASPAPEPATALLTIGGGFAVLALRRRKRRA